MTTPIEYYNANLESLYNAHPDKWIAVSATGLVAVTDTLVRLLAHEDVKKTRVELVYGQLDSKVIPGVLAEQNKAKSKTKPAPSSQTDKKEAKHADAPAAAGMADS